ncbi:hypothetical protein KPL71_026505 [Citrus sinensis]|uniref:Uncharacterized protein n=1 Tax=Citrus sinensis TaxID=2711 RepID=A0ACB8HZS7_CITSI|nr:hypothetical protein KPL71_026505 [Citrus sinensis]
MDIEELNCKCKAISIREDQLNKISLIGRKSAKGEQIAASLIGRKSAKGEQIAACCLMGMILHQRKVNLEGLRCAMSQIWRTNKEVRIESLGSNIFMFKFFLEADKKRVMGGGPWHFDRALIVLTEPKEIERTARRLRREHRELQAVVAMDDLQDLRNLNRREGIQPVNVHEGLNGQCVQRQPRNNNIIHMTNDRDRAIRDYAMLTPQAIHPGIVRPDVQADNFDLKPEALRLRLFPFSLRDRARAWLNSLPPDSITTWSDLADKCFLKYFPPTKNVKLRNEITSFHQLEDESLCDAWERFKELLRKCPHHGIPYCIQLETFYNGLNPSTRLMVDALANGALLSKSYNEAYEILERIANNYQWPSTRQAAARGTTGVHNVDALTALSAQVTSLTKIVNAMTTAPATVNQISDMSCVYCGEGHLFDNCPGNLASINYMGSFNRQNQDNPYSNTHNPRWRQHPNFSWSYQNQTAAAPSGQNRPAQLPGFYQQNQEQRSINNDQLSSLEGLIKDYIVKNEAVVQSHTVSLRNLENQIGQLATALSNRPQGSLPSNIEDPRREGKEHCKVINLRSRKDVDSPVGVPKRKAEPTSIQKETQIEKESQSSTSQHTGESSQAAAFFENDDPTPVDNEAVAPTQNMAKEKQSAQPAATQHRMLQSKILQKMKDPRSFTIPCSIGTKYNGKALCDLGASINLMPLSVFKQLGVSECRPTTVTLQLADRSHAYSEGKIEDVLVKVDKFIFLVDFIVLDFEADKKVSIILGRPFLATGKTLIDVQKGELTMRVNYQQVTFNVLDVIKSPDEIEDCNFISVVDFVVAERLHSCCSKEEINAVTFEELDDEDH